MKYYYEQGNEIPESEIDLEKGHLEIRETTTIPEQKEQSHIEKIQLNPDFTLSWVVIDVPYVPEHEEPISYTYILNGPTIDDRVTALEDDNLAIMDAIDALMSE